MKNKKRLAGVAYKIIIALFWLLLWQIISIIVDNSYFVPSVFETAVSLWSIILSGSFFKVISLTVLRVAAGLSLGVAVGIVLAALCHRFRPLSEAVTPIISIIKSTPVASFVIILWILMSGDMLAIFIAFLMVMPLVWQNLMDGYNSIDPQLSEVTEIFCFSYAKKLKLLIIPALSKYLIPAVITASGLAWKAEIAAEIIAYTKNSIGEQINDAKGGYDTPTVFAWTVIVILLSIILEKLIKRLLLKFNSKEKELL